MKNSTGFRPVIDHLIDIKKELPDFASNEEMIHHLVTLYSAVGGRKIQADDTYSENEIT